MKPTVVVGYERTLAGGRALLEAGSEAACRGADVTVVHAFGAGAQNGGRGETEAAKREAAAATVTFGAGVLSHRYPGLTVHVEALAGVPYEVLAMTARGAELLVLGSGYEDGRAEQPLNPVAERTLARTPCPVMVVRSAERYPKGVVLAAVDLEEQADEVVNFAFAEARYHGARLRAVSAVSAVSAVESSRVPVGVGVRADGPLPRRAEAAAALDRMLDEHSARSARVVAAGDIVAGPPASALIAASAHADLVVTGARRRDGEHSGVRIGPVTDALLRAVVCPVIVVPHH